MTGRTRVISSCITGLLVFTLVVGAQETRGTPGVDYPDYSEIPKTSFSCSGQKYFPGFYADLETKCQVFHLCLKDRQESFLCPTGTTYNQAKLTCDSWYNSNCSLAPSFYSVNSGPVMESSSKSIPMLIKLRNRSQKRPSFGPPTANVYEKITSLYEGTADEAQSSFGTPNLSEDVNAESNSEVSSEVRSEEVPEEAQEASENEWQLNEDVLSRMNTGIRTDEESLEDLYYQDAVGQEAEENMEPGVFYDPGTEQYYVDYNSQNEWQRDPEDDNFRNAYDYGSFVDKYIALNEDDERLRNSESKVGDYLDEFNQMLGTGEVDENEQLLGRIMEVDQPSKRLRRKPLYATVQGEDETRGIEYPVVNKDESVLEGSEASFQLEGIVTESAEMADQADTDELRMPNFTPLNASEVPLTSSEFSERIITELVVPRIDELDLRLISSLPTDEYSDGESSASDSQDTQSDDQYSFVENLTPDGYESYSTDYNGDDTVIVERLDEETPDEEQRNLYRSGDEVGTEDTFVVIPDESEEDDLEQSSETDGQAESLDAASYYSVESDEQNQNGVAYDSYEALRNYFLSNYAPTAAHASVDPYRFQTPEVYFPNEYGRQRSYVEGFPNTENRERFQSPYEYVDHSGSTSDQQIQTGYTYGDSPARYYPGYTYEDLPARYYPGYTREDSSTRYYPSVEPGSYAYEEPASFADYTYGAENGYRYRDVYANAYDKANMNFGYDASEMENSESSDETRYLDFNPAYSEPEIPSWIRSDSIETTEREQLGVAHSSSPTEDYLSQSQSGSESFDEISVPEEREGVSFEDENMKQEEIYYLLDDEEDSQGNVQVQPEGNAETSEPDTEQLDLQELFQRQKPWQLDELSEVSGINALSEPESTESAEETLIAEEDSAAKNVNMESPDVSESAANTNSREGTDSWSFQSTESSQVNEKPATLSSVLEQLAGLNNVKTSKGSDSTNINLSRNKFFNNMGFPEANEFGASAVTNRGQDYSITDASTLRNTDNVLSYRTGNYQQPSASKLSAIQERIRSLKQGRFGAFKKYINSA